MRNKFAAGAILLMTVTAVAFMCSVTTGRQADIPEDAQPTQLQAVLPEPTETDGRLPGDDIPATEYAVLQEPTMDELWGEEAEYIAKTIYGEALVCSTTERAAVAWCILNRVDSDDSFYPDDIIGVVTQSRQLHGYDAEHPVLPELYDLALDVIERWLQEKNGAEDAGRVLPAEYLFFSGDGTHNCFRTEWRGGTVWDWSLPSPYEE